MKLKIKNTWEYIGNDTWNWNVFLDDDGSGELAEVESVDYILHPTFPNPVRHIDTSENNFELHSSGWGSFLLRAYANLKNGKTLKLTHALMLSKEPKVGKSD